VFIGVVDVVIFATIDTNDDADELLLIGGTDAICTSIAAVDLVTDCVGTFVGSVA
jgi:hypothetical protein